MKVVYSYFCLDILHIGHILMIFKCKKSYADYSNSFTDINNSLTALTDDLVKRYQHLSKVIDWYKFLKFISGKKIYRNKFSLNALLDQSSSYHEEFMPVYRAITSPPKGVELSTMCRE